MNLGTENRKKTITAAALGMVAVICIGYLLYTLFGGDSTPTPPPAVAPVNAPGLPAPAAAPAATASANGAGGTKTLVLPTGNAAGVPANKVGSASASLDPTLDEVAMLRTEHLVYSGSGRNIFSAVYTPPPPPPPKPIAPPRPIQQVIQQPVIQQQITCPPTCPPIPLKFFGTETLANGSRQAFLLQGDDVFLAAAGDIVARRYRIVSVNTNSVQVEDMGNKNTQTLPLQSN